MLKRWNKWNVLLLLQFIGWKIIFSNQDFVAFWFNNFTFNYAKTIYVFTSKINFPVGELFYIILIIIASNICLRIIKLKDVTEKFSLLFKTLFFVILVYNSLWGIVNYKKNFSISKDEVKIEVKELKDMYFNHLDVLIKTISELEKSEDQPIDFIYNTEIYLQDIQHNTEKLKAEQWVNKFYSPEKLTVKSSSFSLLLSYFGVLGYYNPFTIESNINSNNSELKTPFTISHELAHQMGFASENEANFVAYYLGVNSDIKEVQYSAYYKTTFSLLNAISKHDTVFVNSELERLPKGIEIDRLAEIDHYKKYDGKLNDLFSSLNNQFLKANNQDGLVSYSKYIELVYYYNKQKKLIN